VMPRCALPTCVGAAGELNAIEGPKISPLEQQMQQLGVPSAAVPSNCSLRKYRRLEAHATKCY
jgi:hypothetical protein